MGSKKFCMPKNNGRNENLIAFNEGNPKIRNNITKHEKLEVISKIYYFQKPSEVTIPIKSDLEDIIEERLDEICFCTRNDYNMNLTELLERS